MEDLIVWRKTQHSVINKNVVIVTQSSWAISLCKISDLPLQEERDQIQCEGLNPQEWCSAATLNTTLNMPEFLDALTVFVRDCRNEADGIESTDNALNRRSKNSLSVASYHVCIHGSLKCWKQGGNTLQDLERWVEERVYCTPDWQRRRGLWRHDCILVQQQPEDTETAFSVLRGWLPDRLQIIISVKDPLWKNAWDKLLRYTDALVNLFQSLNKSCSHDIHKMIELSDWSAQIFNNSQIMRDCRFFIMSNILWSVHIISAPLGTRQRSGAATYYLNNFVDWDSYNTIYKEDFLNKGTKVALYYSCGR